MEKKKEMDSRKENKSIQWIWKKHEVMLDIRKNNKTFYENKRKRKHEAVMKTEKWWNNESMEK